MRYPGYLLNPGDMFQVEPERVMFATGIPKHGVRPNSEGEAVAAEEHSSVFTEDTASKAEAATEPDEEKEEDTRDPRTILKDLISQTKTILASQRSDIGAKRKQDLRAFSSSVKRILSRAKSSTIMSDNLEAQFLELQNQLKIKQEVKIQGKASPPSAQKAAREEVLQGDAKDAASGGQMSTADTDALEKDHNVVSKAEYNDLLAALEMMKENPVDETKPYATPWMPREYMSAFAFIPRYLEVNHNICAAVYLRHPVARPGEAEVPSPYGEATSTSAFAWYLRRR